MGFKYYCLVIWIFMQNVMFAQLYDFTKPERIASGINTSADESNPVLSEDGKTLYFVRTFEPKNTGGIYDQDIWLSRKTESIWGAPFPLKALNNKLHNAVISEQINTEDSSQRILYLLSSYGTERDLEKGISIAGRKSTDTNWLVKKKLALPGLDIDGQYVGYCISADQKVVIISYEGSDSEGEEDLYYCIKGNDGWSEPENLGSSINSPGYEMSPFLSKNNDTLFFSSNGFKGFGDADIYYSVRKNKWTNWSKPMNLGKSVNTPYFDAYFSLKNNQAIWSSNREGKDLDIWTAWAIEPPELIITINSIKDVSEFQGSDGAIDIEIVSGIKPYKYVWSNGQNTQDINYLIKGDYKLQITDSIGQKITHTFTINEPEAQAQSIIRFPNIQYAFNKWTFVNDSIVNSYDSLACIAKLLSDYPKLTIELISHTDARGEEARNQILSENRAKACYIYLVDTLKVDPRRIVPVGKGESEPAKWFDPETKTMVLLSETYIQTKKENEALFEFLNQLNRRTEGKILNVNFDTNTAVEAPKQYREFQTIP